MQARRLARPLVGLAALAIVVAGCGGVPGGASGGGESPVALPGPGGGLVGGAGFSEGAGIGGRSDAELAAELDGIKAAGATYVRFDIDWWLVQPTPTTWNWAPIDRVVDAVRARGLKVLGMIGYSPPWARPPGSPDKTPPTNPADYANFARAAVERYAARGVHDWEVWNEPNISMFWQPRPDPAAYVRLLIPAYKAIKGADPGANVITAGFSPAIDLPDGRDVAPVTFLRAMYAAGAKGSFDSVGHHPSNYPNMPMQPVTDYRNNPFGGVAPVLHETMEANGDGAKKIWATEMGAPTVEGMTPEYLAEYLTEAYEVWESWPWTGPLLWYSYRDGWDSPGEYEANFGLVKADGTPKGPALTAYKQVVAG